VRRLSARWADERVPSPDLVLHRTSIAPIRDEGQFFRICPLRALGTFAFARQTSRMSRVASFSGAARAERRAGRNSLNIRVKVDCPLDGSPFEVEAPSLIESSCENLRFPHSIPERKSPSAPTRTSSSYGPLVSRLGDSCRCRLAKKRHQSEPSSTVS